MDIVLANAEDVPHIMAIFRECIAKMASEGLYQWSDLYPNIEGIKEDIQAKALFMLKQDGDLLGVITLNEDQPEEYADVQWLEQNMTEEKKNKALVVHRLAVHPKWQKQGIAFQLMQFAEIWAKDQGYQTIRLDTFSENKQAIAFYERLDYDRRGEVHFPHKEPPFYCFEKVV